MNIYKNKIMLAAVEQIKSASSFLRDRFFTFGDGDIFPCEEVLAEYKDSTGQKMAPVVMPRKGRISVERDGYTTSKLSPPLIAPSRPLTIDDLNRRQMGENLFSDKTPQQRQAEILNLDLADLDEMITAREEYIAAQCMFNNGYVLKQYADKYGSGEFTEFEMKFYTEGANPAQYVPGVKWGESTADILADLHQMVLMLTSKGNRATDVILGADAADKLLSNPKILEMLDTNNYRIGQIDPAELPQDAARLGRLNIRGRALELFTYDGTYVDEETGILTPYVPAKQICVTAPGAGRALYGAITQMEQSTNQYETHMGRRVPQYWADQNGRTLTMSSRPLFVPRTKNPFISATVLD